MLSLSQMLIKYVSICSPEWCRLPQSCQGCCPAIGPTCCRIAALLAPSLDLIIIIVINMILVMIVRLRPFVSKGIMEQSPGRLAEHLYTAPPCLKPRSKWWQTSWCWWCWRFWWYWWRSYLVHAWLSCVRLRSSNKQPAKQMFHHQSYFSSSFHHSHHHTMIIQWIAGTKVISYESSLSSHPCMNHYSQSKS